MRMEIKADHLLRVFDAVAATNRDELVFNLKDDRIISKTADGAGVLMSAVRLNQTAMEDYSSGPSDELAFNFTKVANFIDSKNDIIRLEFEDNKLHVYDDSAHVVMGVLDPESVEGSIPSAPSHDYEVTAVGSPDRLLNFISRIEDTIGTSHYYVGAREEGLYLYSSADTGHMDDFIPKDHFKKYDTNWEINNTSGANSHTPAEDEAIDVIMAIEFTKAIQDVNDTCRMNFANHMPMKWVFTGGEDGVEGLDVSFIQAPRLDNEGETTVPDSVIQKH